MAEKFREFDAFDAAVARAVLGAVYWIALVTAFIVLRAQLIDGWLNIDEAIPIKVAAGMIERGDLNPNWRLADLPDGLRYDQFNFYFYNILAAGVINLAAASGLLAPWSGLNALDVLRLANIPLQLAAMLFALDALRRMGLRATGLAICGALFTFAPGMVQDAGMARAESLIYLLIALLIWTQTLPLSWRWRVLLAGVVLGIGIAVKVSFALAMILVAVPFALRLRDTAWSELAVSGGVLPVGAVLGFAAAAPYAVLQPDVFLHGIASLSAQYSSGHPPHSLPVYNFAEQALWILRYFTELYGAVLLLALAAPFMAHGPARTLVVGLVLAWMVLFAYFSGQAVFFERNFSHVVVPLLMAASLTLALIRRTSLRAVAMGLALLPMAFWSVQIARASASSDRIAAFETSHGIRMGRDSSWLDFASAPPDACRTVAVRDFNDDFSEGYLDRLRREGYEQVAHYRSPFSPLVTSTLHTYLDRDVHYFRCPRR